MLRFPAFVVRDSPEVVALQIARALRQAAGGEAGLPQEFGQRAS